MTLVEPIERTTEAGVFIREYPPRSDIFACSSCGATDGGTIRGVCLTCFDDPARRPTPICKGCCEPIPEGQRWCSDMCYRLTDGDY